MGARLLVIPLILFSCSGAPTRPDEPPQPPVEKPCEAAESKLLALDCRRPDGDAWVEAKGDFASVCEDARADGRDWHPECIAKITTCSDLEPAYRGELCR